MRQMIKDYEKSCELAKQRRNALIDELDLERRIRLLYTEHSQMKEIVLYLTSYVRRVEQRAEA